MQNTKFTLLWCHWGAAAFTVALGMAASVVTAGPVDPDALPPVPTGFSKGHLFLSFSSGELSPPRGSLVEQEKAYDANIRVQVSTGNLTVRVGSVTVPASTFPVILGSSFRTSKVGQTDLEYALTNWIGLGLSYSSFSIHFSQQDVVSTYSTSSINGQPTLQRQDSVFLLPIRQPLFNGNLLQVLASVHFLSGRVVDPFIAVRAGGSSFETMAHHDTSVDPYRYLRRPHGTGRAVGAGVGVNVHFSDQYALRVEAAGQRQLLQSEVFARRSLSTFQMAAGLTVNVTRFADMD